jgi:hypothetical protein
MVCPHLITLGSSELKAFTTTGCSPGFYPYMRFCTLRDGRRIIVEVCCSNLKYDAENILFKARIPGIDLVIAVVPDNRTRKALDETLKKNLEYSSKVCQESIRLLDAGRCLAEEFDWAGVLVNRDQKTQKKEPNN